MKAPSKPRPRSQLGLVLIALALVPLMGLGTLGAVQVSGALDARSKLDELEPATNELLAMVELEAALVDESYWTEAHRVSIESGFSNDLVVNMLQIDLKAEYETALDQTNDALQPFVGTQMEADVLAARDAAPEASNPRLSPISQLISGPIRSAVLAQTTEVTALASELDRGGSLVFAADVLRRSNALRSSLSDVIASSLFLITFGSNEDNQTFVNVAGNKQSYEQRHTDLAQLISTHPPLESEWNLLTEDASSTALLAEVDLLLQTGRQDMTATPVETMTLTDLRVLASVFASAIGATDAHMMLVDAAGQDLQLELGRLATTAEKQASRTTGGVLLVAVLTLASVMVATRSIVRPLRDLSSSATALTAGDTTPTLVPRGPTEIRSVARTLNEARVNLQRAEVQALALADGRLDDPSLIQPVAGNLGESLQNAVGRLSQSIAEGKRYRTQLRHEASHDGLTQLPNRRASVENLARVLEEAADDGTQTAVLFLDLDGFKRVNDLRGHPVGDQVLAEVASSLAASCRAGDHLGRLGGDEFLLVATIKRGAEEATTLACRARQAVLAASRAFDDSIIHLDVSIGIVLADRGQRVDQLMADVDVALYEAKKRGQGAIQVCDDALRGRIERERDLGVAIRLGLVEGQFELHAQALVGAEDGAPITAEALLRWNRPGYGYMSPTDFIDYAERSDLIIEIDRWVIANGIEQLARWRHEPGLESMHLAINISGRHLLDEDLFHEVTAALDKWSVDPRTLLIEITEGAMLEDLGQAAHNLGQLRALGVRIAIDDFGTGYTSLAHLRNLPVDVLKVDRSFTANIDSPDDLSLVKMIINTGHILGLEVTIEGVETAEQEQVLRSLGADVLQGYRYSKPLPMQELASQVQALQRGRLATC